ncbi:hypothetical protein ACF0H5_005547 [Mactra antiquata]
MAAFNMFIILILGFVGLSQAYHETYPVLQVNSCTYTKSFVQTGPTHTCHTFREICGENATITFNGTGFSDGGDVTAVVYLDDPLGGDYASQEVIVDAATQASHNITALLRDQSLCLSTSCNGRPLNAGVRVTSGDNERVEETHLFFRCDYSDGDLTLSFANQDMDPSLLIDDESPTLSDAMDAAGFNETSVTVSATGVIPDKSFLVSGYIILEPDHHYDHDDSNSTYYYYYNYWYTTTTPPLFGPSTEGSYVYYPQYHSLNPTPSSIHIASKWTKASTLDTDFTSVLQGVVHYDQPLPCGKGKVVILADTTHVFWNEPSRYNNYIFWDFYNDCGGYVPLSPQICSIAHNSWSGSEMVLSNEWSTMANIPSGGWNHVYDYHNYGLLNVFQHMTEVEPFKENYDACMNATDLTQYVTNLEGVQSGWQLSELTEVPAVGEAINYIDDPIGTFLPTNELISSSPMDIIRHNMSVAATEAAGGIVYGYAGSKYEACRPFLDNIYYAQYVPLTGLSSYSFYWFQGFAMDLTRCYIHSREPALIGVMKTTAQFDNVTALDYTDLSGGQIVNDCYNMPYFAQKLTTNFNESGATCESISGMHKETVCKAITLRQIAKTRWYEFGLSHMIHYDGDLDCSVVPTDGPTKISHMTGDDIFSGYFNADFSQYCYKKVATCTCAHCLPSGSTSPSAEPTTEPEPSQYVDPYMYQRRK